MCLGSDLEALPTAASGPIVRLTESSEVAKKAKLTLPLISKSEFYFQM